MGQLAYWDKLGFFQPQYAAEDRKTPYSRIYSFKDVVGLRTLSILRSKYKCSLPHLQTVAKELASYSNAPWAEITLYVLQKRVQFKEPETGRVRGVVDGQYALLPIASVMEDMRKPPSIFGSVNQRKLAKSKSTVMCLIRRWSFPARASAWQRFCDLSKLDFRLPIFSRNSPPKFRHGVMALGKVGSGYRPYPSM
jgi:hypothetical protein